jgi:hypothetical protein
VRELPYRKKILQELKKLHDKNGPGRYILVNHLKFFKPGNQEFFEAVNQLLNEKLIKVISSDELKAISLNLDKIDEIKKEVTNPKFWIMTLIAFAIFLWIVISFLLRWVI